MKGVKDNEEPPEDYWEDYENECEDLDSPNTDNHPKNLISEINIKDLCDGKEVMFQTGKNFIEDFDDDDDNSSDEVPYYNLKSLRENRGGPPLNRTFKEICSTMTHLTEDGLVKKQVITSGVGKVVPDHAYVTIHYNLYKESCELPFDSTYLRNRPEKFKLSQGETLLGLEYAVKSMKKNENSIFFIKWELAFGELGCPDRIEEKCDIVADITLMNFMDLQTDDLNCDSQTERNEIDFRSFINQVKKLICNGSDDFSKGDARNAAFSYRKALKILSNLRLANEEEEKIMLTQKLKCLVNLAICYNKLGRHEHACTACQQALSIDSNNVKANFHYGRANIALSNFSAAKRYLLRANRLKPNDKDINCEIKRLNDKKALHEVKDKLFWKKAFSEDKKNGNEKAEEKEREKAEEEEEEKEREEGKEIGKEERSQVNSNLEPRKMSSLEQFEKDLLSNLEKSLKEGKSYTLEGSLSDDQIKICRKVAAEKNSVVEIHTNFCLLKKKTNN